MKKSKMIRLSRGFIQKMIINKNVEVDEETDTDGVNEMPMPFLQIISVKQINNNSRSEWSESNRDPYLFTIDVSDGESILEGVKLGSHLNDLVGTGKSSKNGKLISDSDSAIRKAIEPFSVVHMQEMVCDVDSNENPIMIIVAVDVKVRGSDLGTVIGNPSVVSVKGRSMKKSNTFVSPKSTKAGKFVPNIANIQVKSTSNSKQVSQDDGYNGNAVEAVDFANASNCEEYWDEDWESGRVLTNANGELMRMIINEEDWLTSPDPVPVVVTNTVFAGRANKNSQKGDNDEWNSSIPQLRSNNDCGWDDDWGDDRKSSVFQIKSTWSDPIDDWGDDWGEEIWG